MDSEFSGETRCLERLRREAFNCLETFPKKIIELNEIVDEHIPESVKSGRRSFDDASSVDQRAGRRPALCAARSCEPTIVSDFDVTSYYSPSTRGRSRHGICKRKYYRIRGIAGSSARRRPGPLGQLLAFLVGRLSLCTRKMLVAPSQFILDGVMSMVFQRHDSKNVQGEAAEKSRDSLSSDATVRRREEKSTSIDDLVEIARPATVQLIARTTILKRWLQAVALSNGRASSTELTNVTRTTETIDCWAYELFFHLKYLRANCVQGDADKEIEEKRKEKDQVTLVNLWHRMVQLRDNYIILYETLQNYDKICRLRSFENK